VTDRVGPWRLGYQHTLGGGLVYTNAGLTTAAGRNDLDPYYIRASIDGSASRGVTGHLDLRLRGYAAVSTGADGPTAKQRQVYLSGADPLERMNNPFLRSRGALLLRPNEYYHMTGGANLRGYDPTVSTTAVVAANLDLSERLLTRDKAKLFRRASLEGFGDAGQAIEDKSIPGDPIRFLGDAGLALSAEHRIGETSFVTRVGFPLYVSRPELAQDTHPGSDAAGFRWFLSIEAK
jgi:hypothetical protein